MNYKNVKYCTDCGHLLKEVYLEGEGMVPYCPSCKEHRFPIFNTAVSMIVYNEDSSKILLIKQYNRPHHILVAGYVNKGEDAEDALARELMEEVGLSVVEYRFNRSHYFARSNTLLLNFVVRTAGKVQITKEVDSFEWFSVEEAKCAVKNPSLARAFLLGHLTGEFSFPNENRIER